MDLQDISELEEQLLIPEGSFGRTFFYACALGCLIYLCSPVFCAENRLYAQDKSFTTVIDPDDYIVAPGDQFRIDFWNGAVSSLNLTVTPEGSVLIVSMGLVDRKFQT